MRRTFFSPRLVKFSLLIALAGATVAPEIARAQKGHSASDVESAREAFKEGLKLREAGNLKGALEKFQAAHALGRTPVTGIELAKTYASLGQPVEGREICIDIGRTAVAPQETARSQEARKEAATLAEELKKKIATLRLHVTGAPAGSETEVTVDGATVPFAAINEPRSVNPGTHAIAAHVGQGPETKTTVDVKEGESKDVELAVKAPPPLPPPSATVAPPPTASVTAPPPPPPPTKMSPLVPTGLVIAGLGIGVGTVTGIVAIGKKSTLDSECGATKVCGPGTHDDLHSAQTWGNVATVSWIVAGVGAGIAVTGFFLKPSAQTQTGTTPQKPTVEPYVGVGAAGVHGTF